MLPSLIQVHLGYIPELRDTGSSSLKADVSCFGVYSLFLQLKGVFQEQRVIWVISSVLWGFLHLSLENIAVLKIQYFLIIWLVAISSTLFCQI